MHIEARVKAGSKRNKITPQKTAEGKTGASLVVEVKAPARDGKANQALIKLLAEHFKVPQAAVKIKRGATSSRKLLEIKSL